MSRRLPTVLLCALVLLGLASFGVWWWIEGKMQQALAAATQDLAARGWTVHAATTERGGWPLAADLSLDDFSLSGGADELPGGAAYTAARLTFHLDLLQPTVLLVQGEGRQTIRLGPTRTQPFTAERTNLSIPLAQGTPPTRVVLDAKTVRFAAPEEGLTIGLLQGHVDWHAAETAPNAVGFRLSAEAIALPPPPAPPPALGPHIASATVEGSVSNVLPLGLSTPVATLTGWRDRGGVVRLQHIALGWGPLGVTGTASLKLDAALQPDATATLRLVGIEETLTALAAARVITPRAAQAAKAVAGLLAQAPQGGGAAGVEVPVSLHDGTVALGMIPLATVEKLNWSDRP